MLPCQNHCPHFFFFFYKNCAAWKEFQAQQAAQRQAKKQYLKFYDTLCTQIIHQYQAMQSRRPVW